MLHLDDVQLYELSEAGPLLFRDPARLAREARIRRIPAARLGTDLGLPAPWVEAATGASAADPESVATYWLGRLAPPAPGARKPRRDRSRLPAESLVTPTEAARRLFATPPALERLDHEGRMPSLRVDGEVFYDGALIDRMAAEDPDTDAIESRRAEVRAWARYEYETAPAPTAVAPSTVTPTSDPTTSEPSAATPAEEAPPAPAAFEIPADLGLEDIDAGPTSDLLDIEGFDTIDED